MIFTQGQRVLLPLLSGTNSSYTGRFSRHNAKGSRAKLPEWEVGLYY